MHRFTCHNVISGLGPPRPRRPLAFVQPCPMGVTPLVVLVLTPQVLILVLRPQILVLVLRSQVLVLVLRPQVLVLKPQLSPRPNVL